MHAGEKDTKIEKMAQRKSRCVRVHKPGWQIISQDSVCVFFVGRRQRSFHLSGGIPSLLSLFIWIHSFVTENIISFTYYPLFILLQHIQVAFFTFIDFPLFSPFSFIKSECRVLTEFDTHRCVSSVFLTNIRRYDENGWNQPICVHISHVLFSDRTFAFRTL